MADKLPIHLRGPIQATIRPPGSKSLTNRALVCAALADGVSTIECALDSEDTRVMVDGLRQLGVSVDVDSQRSVISVGGCGGRFGTERADLYVANSGTTVRFLTALTALGTGEFRLDGIERMRQRPIQDLLDALQQLGADAVSETGSGCPPVLVRASGLPGGSARLSGETSSQYLSALLMVSPYAARDVRIEVTGPLVSRPYVHLTLGVMAAFGMRVERQDLNRFDIAAPQRYQATHYVVEPDASAASYFWAAAAITQGSVTVEGLSRSSLQGDVKFCDCLQRMGCQVEGSGDRLTVTGPGDGNKLAGIEADMNEISDTVQTLAAVALFADGPTTITGVAHIRHKETDRIGNLAKEIRKIGAEVHEREDGLEIIPAELRSAEIDTYNDHRMAMSLALVGLQIAGIVIRDPRCVAKTYPNFFADLQALR